MEPKINTKIESHVVEHNGLKINVQIINRGGVYVPLSYIVYKGAQAINHRLSDSFIKKIEEILRDYCYNMNADFH
jgi:hypothetical protein